MENRFKFRVWDKRNEEYIDNFLVDYEGTLFDCYYPWQIDEIYNDDNRYIIMQSTGLSDKNGKLIFEGDILDNKDCSDSIVKVVFLFPSNENGNRYGFFLENLNTHSVKNFLNPDIDLNKFEVISNVYENKELIGE